MLQGSLSHQHYLQFFDQYLTEVISLQFFCGIKDKKKLDRLSIFIYILASQVMQWERTHLQEMQVQSLGWEDFLEKKMGTHSSVLAWESPWTEEPGRVANSRTGLSN